MLVREHASTADALQPPCPHPHAAGGRARRGVQAPARRRRRQQRQRCGRPPVAHAARLLWHPVAAAPRLVIVSRGASCPDCRPPLLSGWHAAPVPSFNSPDTSCGCRGRLLCTARRGRSCGRCSIGGANAGHAAAWWRLGQHAGLPGAQRSPRLNSVIQATPASRCSADARSPLSRSAPMARSRALACLVGLCLLAGCTGECAPAGKRKAGGAVAAGGRHVQLRCCRQRLPSSRAVNTIAAGCTEAWCDTRLGRRSARSRKVPRRRRERQCAAAPPPLACLAAAWPPVASCCQHRTPSPPLLPSLQPS